MPLFLFFLMIRMSLIITIPSYLTMRKRVDIHLQKPNSIFNCTKKQFEIEVYYFDNSLFYRNNLKNRFLMTSAFSQNSHLRLRLVHAQWSLAPDENFEKPPLQIPDSSGHFGISLNASMPGRCPFSMNSSEAPPPV